MTNKTYRTVIIEPSPIVREGLKTLLKQNTHINIVGMLSDLNRYEERLAPLRAEIIILNPMVVDYNRRTAIKTLLPDVQLVALIYSFLDKQILQQFKTTIGIYDIADKIENSIKEMIALIHKDENENEVSEDLTDREKEILISVAKGMINKDIATQHTISIHTVISHRKNISRKTGIKSVSGLTVYALLNNLIEENDIQ